MKRSTFALALIGLGLSFSALQAQIVLDEVMSREEQKKTGVTKLTANEKIALEGWLNKNFVLKTKEEAPKTQLSLSINIDHGQKLQLSDNSLWEIAPDDVSKAAVWITPFPVQISSSGDLNYPCLITDVNSGTSVRARPASTQTQMQPQP